MAKQLQHTQSRNTERIWLLAITILLAFLFNDLFKVLKRDFIVVPQRLSDGTMIDLNESFIKGKCNFFEQSKCCSASFFTRIIIR